MNSKYLSINVNNHSKKIYRDEKRVNRMKRPDRFKLHKIGAHIYCVKHIKRTMWSFVYYHERK